MYQLQERLDGSEFATGSRGRTHELGAQIAREGKKPWRAQEQVFPKCKDGENFLTESKKKISFERNLANYQPARSLPIDSVLVVRTGALRDFVLSQGQQLEAEDLVDSSLVQDPEVLIRTERKRSINNLPSVIGDEVRPNGRNVSTARREARKLNTQAMYKGWQKAYRLSFKKRPGESDVWHSIQISRQEIAKGRNAETIRKHMKS